MPMNAQCIIRVSLSILFRGRDKPWRIKQGVLVHVKDEIRNSHYTDTKGNSKILTEILAKFIKIINENNSKIDSQGD